MSLFHGDSKTLVVDDFPTMRRIIITLLKQSGFKSFLEAENGSAALIALRANADINLVVMNWSLPLMTGVELLKAARSDAKFKDLPFLVVCTDKEKDEVSTSDKSGLTGHVVKPFTTTALREKLDKIEASHLAKKQAG